MDLVLILARDLASALSTPAFLVDSKGTLIFYNEPAEAILGEKYAEAGELAPDEWGTMWAPQDPESGEEVPLEKLPLYIALTDRTPAYAALCITGSDGVRRKINVIAFPLMTQVEDLVGAVAIFWEAAD